MNRSMRPSENWPVQGAGLASFRSPSRFTFKLRKTAKENARWSTGKDPFCCTNEELSIDDVIGAFQEYANSNDAWKAEMAS